MSTKDDRKKEVLKKIENGTYVDDPEVVEATRKLKAEIDANEGRRS